MNDSVYDPPPLAPNAEGRPTRSGEARPSAMATDAHACGLFVAPGRSRSLAGIVVLLAALTVSTGCVAAVGAAMAAQEIRQGLAGVQQLVAGARSLRTTELEIPQTLDAPLAGTYRGYQALGDDTVRYFVRTVSRPAAPILDDAGNVTGYVLPGIAAASLETLEAGVGAWTRRESGEGAGRAIFFVEGTQAPEPNVRSLYPAAFLGRLARGESEAADRQAAELRRLELDMEAPDFSRLSGQGIPHELFGSVAEGIFTVRPDGAAVYHQEYETEDGRTVILHFERISETTLPETR
jgi:hypothetical protein